MQNKQTAEEFGGLLFHANTAQPSGDLSVRQFGRLPCQSSGRVTALSVGELKSTLPALSASCSLHCLRLRLHCLRNGGWNVHQGRLRTKDTQFLHDLWSTAVV